VQIKNGTSQYQTHTFSVHKRKKFPSFAIFPEELRRPRVTNDIHGPATIIIPNKGAFDS